MVTPCSSLKRISNTADLSGEPAKEWSNLYCKRRKKEHHQSAYKTPCEPLPRAAHLPTELCTVILSLLKWQFYKHDILLISYKWSLFCLFREVCGETAKLSPTGNQKKKRTTLKIKSQRQPIVLRASGLTQAAFSRTEAFAENNSNSPLTPSYLPLPL